MSIVNLAWGLCLGCWRSCVCDSARLLQKLAENCILLQNGTYLSYVTATTIPRSRLAPAARTCVAGGTGGRAGEQAGPVSLDEIFQAERRLQGRWQGALDLRQLRPAFVMRQQVLCASANAALRSLCRTWHL